MPNDSQHAEDVMRTAVRLNGVEVQADVQIGHPDAGTGGGSTAPDPAWRHVDSFGHIHAYGCDGSLPTLERREREAGYYFDDLDNEVWAEEYWVCALCGEEVTPGPYMRSHRRSIAGTASLVAVVDPVPLLLCHEAWQSMVLHNRMVMEIVVSDELRKWEVMVTEITRDGARLTAELVAIRALENNHV